MQLERLTVWALELKTDISGKPDGYFEGYGSTFNNVDKGDDIIDPRAFDKTMEEHKAAGTMPHMFFNHQSTEPVGDWKSMKCDSKGLHMSGMLWTGKGIAKSEQTYMMLKSPTEKGLSIGYQTRNSERDQATGARRLLDVAVKEVSPVAFPMNGKANITSIKSLMHEGKLSTVRQAEEYLRDAGFSGTEAKAFLAQLNIIFDAQRDVVSKSNAEAIDLFKKSLQNLNLR